MVPPIALLALRVGFVSLLWVFVLAIVLAMRSDLSDTPRRRRANVLTPVRATPAPEPKLGKADKAKARKEKKQPRLVVTDGPLAGTVIALGLTPITIGRGENCTLVLDDDFVSTAHARLSPRDGLWYVEDLGSTNGTFLDRTKVSSPVLVPEGGSVRIGRTALELRA